MQTYKAAQEAVTTTQVTLILEILSNALNFLVLVILIVNLRRGGK